MFREEQLNRIKESAEKTKNQGELAVVYLLIMNTDYDYYTPSQWEIIKYCAEECKRQRSGEMSVYDMVNAWNFAHLALISKIDLDFIEEIGRTVEPNDNKNGFRTIPIGVTDGLGGWIEKARWDRVPMLLSTLIESYYDGSLDPKNALSEVPVGEVYGYHILSKTAEDQFYYEYENIHPFRDGNGRSGKIIYNYLNGTLDNPIMPPNFWGGSNP